MHTTPRSGIWFVLAACAGLLAATDLSAAETEVDFNRDVRSVFSNICFECHGPDANQRQTDWRLDTQEGAFGELSDGEFAIVPGKSSESQLYQRISSKEPALQMPPEDFAKQLKPEQIESIKKWIDQGAEWRGHWSFDAPQQPAVPAVEHKAAVKNPIDNFVVARLETEGLAPAPEATKETLIRRVTFDLTGLPPTIAEVDAFLADDSPNAYEKVVDRLLASPRYGEHLGRFWLDAARYGDTHGLHLDNERSLWPYRDWVINAFNDNMPFDQFTVEQLAGDLLPEATMSQKIATGFNRCNVTTSEGGSIAEEYRVRYAVDRVETLSTVWMGMTLGCAVCHDHKFDPFTQKEFYQLFAYYNNVDENPMDGNALLPPPVMKVPTPAQAARQKELDAAIAEKKTLVDGPLPEVDAAQAVWETEWSEQLRDRWQMLNPQQFTSSGGSTLSSLEDSSVLANGENPAKDDYEIITQIETPGITAIRLEALTHESLADNGPGRAGNGNFLLTEFEAEIAPVSDPEKFQPVKFAKALADFSQTDGEYFIAKAIDGDFGDDNGWAVDGGKRHEDRTAFFLPTEPFGFAGGTILKIKLKQQSKWDNHAIGRFRLSITDDGAVLPAKVEDWHLAGPFEAESGKVAFETAYPPETAVDLTAKYNDDKIAWASRPKFNDGKSHRLDGTNCATYLYRTIDAPSPRRATFRLGSDDGIKMWVNGQEVLAHDVQRTVAPDQERVTVDLQQGKNEILLKVVNYGSRHEFYFDKTIENSNSEVLQITPILAKSVENRSDDEKKQLRDYFRRNSSPEWQQLSDELAQLNQERKTLVDAIPATMIMKDRDEPRDCFVLERGEYTKPGEKVEMGVPASMPPLPENAPKNRLALAQWLVAPEHPLTARVTVNRYWQHFFGTGIVKTAEDFGSQGEWPSHPRLLDWLATEFIETGWDVKRMQKLIVMSGTYRQSSNITPESHAHDPQNRLLARGPRFRLDAEMLRDNALFLSGTIVEKIGGKSVRPYQPAGIWKAVGYSGSNTVNFVRDNGDKLYRRSLYIFWKRTAPPPSMITFDAPSRESCTVRRARTNTPLQALVLLNDEQYVEAARKFAERIMTEGGTDAKSRIEFAFRAATARHPNRDEAQLFMDLFNEQLATYQQDSEAAEKLLSVGEAPRNTQLNPAELAAWTIIANTILNLNETLTKG